MKNRMKFRFFLQKITAHKLTGNLKTQFTLAADVRDVGGFSLASDALCHSA